MSNTALDQANAQMASVARFAAALACDFDRLAELSDAWQDLLDSGASGHELDTWKLENGDEMGEFEVVREMFEAGEISSLDRDAVVQAIEADALSVDTRSGWTNAGDDMEAEEFRIVLCTGGPHVEIQGELSQGQASRAWLVYRDWSESGERVNQDGDQDALLAYANCFFFGE